MANDVVATFEKNIEIKCSAEKFFNGWAEHVTLLPKVLPHMFKSTTVVKGDGKSVGSVVDWEYAIDIIFVELLNLELEMTLTLKGSEIIETQFTMADFEFCLIKEPPNFETAKQTIEAIDQKNMVCVKRFYGGDLGKKFHLYRATLKAFKKGNKNYVKWTLNIKKTHDEILEPHNYMAFIEKFTKELDSALITA